MKKIPFNREIILSRMGEIERDIDKLSRYKKISLEEFEKGENFAITEHYLRRALEAVFDIGTHILSRIPGKRLSTYKDIALSLGEEKIVPQNYAKEKLLKMAGYRNRLVHFYAEVSTEQLYQIIQNNLQDFIEFLRHLKIFLEDSD
ncbi:MAG: DUF86 domain-containing protein [Candidatus Atribacteria bacterium]|nr:DUF86 domain-containing protein [Candidatus Atribacteria bacterium]